MRTAEADLGSIWESFDKALVSGRTSSGELLHNFVQGRPVNRTPGWEPPEPTRVVTSPKDDETAQLDLQQRTEQTTSGPSSSPQVPKEKQKTKGIPSPGPNVAPLPETFTGEEVLRIAVTKRGYKFLTKLFYDPQRDDAPGELPWEDLEKALAALDFRVEPLYGSVWQFRPPASGSVGSTRSIHLHEPHPATKIPSEVAWHMRRRLERQYGWTHESFVRKSTANDEES